MSRLSSADIEAVSPHVVPPTDPVGGHCNGAASEPHIDPAASTAGAHANQAGSGQHEPSSLDRVEEMMDEVGKHVGAFTSTLGQRLYRLAAQTREAAEDLWAEAQSIRRGEKNDPPKS